MGGGHGRTSSSMPGHEGARQRGGGRVEGGDGARLVGH
jgi:hypothetical protein